MDTRPGRRQEPPSISSFEDTVATNWKGKRTFVIIQNLKSAKKKKPKPYDWLREIALPSRTQELGGSNEVMRLLFHAMQ